ncbi:MAG: hypothetical protein M0Z94_05555 [Dehalococcoidales bacterium]|nr:hypothetical protein [Dehalococcoidales bacterium]
MANPNVRSGLLPASGGRKPSGRGRFPLAGFALAVAGVVAYRAAFRPWHRRWGATDEEVARPLPGDDLVDNPNYSSTRALTIAASPESVWPWLVQIGQGRGGFYSYDWLENAVGLGIRSADHVVEDLQTLKVGDIIAVEPEGNGYSVIAVEPNALLLLFTDGRNGPGALNDHFRQVGMASTWAFVLTLTPEGGTRLLVRWRARYDYLRSGVPLAYLIGPLLEPVEFLMERQMLLGLRQRAEGGA